MNSSGCVHRGVGECQLVTVVFNFFSGLSEVNIFGMKQLKTGKTKCHAYCLQPSVLLQAGSRYQIWWETTALLFYTPRCYTVFCRSSKVCGNNWRSSRLWASQTHLSAMLRHLAFRPVDMVLFLQYKKTNIWGYIHVKNRWLTSENTLILSLEEDNLSHICINIAHVCTKLHCPITCFGLCV